MTEATVKNPTINKYVHTGIRWTAFAAAGLAILVMIAVIEFPYEQELAVAKRIEAGGGSVTFAYCGPSWIPKGLQSSASVFNRVVQVDFLSMEGPMFPIEPMVLEDVLSLRHLLKIDLGDTPVRNADLENLQQMPNLHEIRVSDTQIGDNGLRHIGKVANVTRLCIDGTQITDEGLSHLAGLVNLKCLFLSRNQIGDTGLKHLRSLVSLRELYLDDTATTDSGLEELQSLKDLTHVSLARSATTLEGRNAFRKVMPRCALLPSP